MQILTQKLRPSHVADLEIKWKKKSSQFSNFDNNGLHFLLFALPLESYIFQYYEIENRWGKVLVG